MMKDASPGVEDDWRRGGDHDRAKDQTEYQGQGGDQQGIG
jgi:hypothetical protein